MLRRLELVKFEREPPASARIALLKRSKTVTAATVVSESRHPESKAKEPCHVAPD